MEQNLTAELWNLIVEPVEQEAMSAGGIALPDTVKEANDYLCAVGRIVSMGPLCFQGERFGGIPAPVKEGDFVAYNAYTGITVKERNAETGKERRFRILHDDNILATVQNPKQVVSYVR